MGGARNDLPGAPFSDALEVQPERRGGATVAHRAAGPEDRLQVGVGRLRLGVDGPREGRSEGEGEGASHASHGCLRWRGAVRLRVLGGGYATVLKRS